MTPFSADELYQKSIIMDGLIIANWGEDIFNAMRVAGLSAANCTCSVWENFTATVQNIVRWNGWFEEFSHLIMRARTVHDIRGSKETGKTAIILGMQNTSAFEDQIGYVEILKQLGVGIAQMTYNTQNWWAVVVMKAVMVAFLILDMMLSLR